MAFDADLLRRRRQQLRHRLERADRLGLLQRRLRGSEQDAGVDLHSEAVRQLRAAAPGRSARAAIIASVMRFARSSHVAGLLHAQRVDADRARRLRCARCMRCIETIGCAATADRCGTRRSSESASTLYLPSFNVEIAYITTKNANSSVMKSAYETSQRSWLSGSSSCATACGTSSVPASSGEVPAEPRLDELRILAVGDAHHPVDEELALRDFLRDQCIFSLLPIGSRIRLAMPTP